MNFKIARHATPNFKLISNVFFNRKFSGLQSEYLMHVEWEKCSLQELDITATDLSAESLIDMLTRLPGLRFLSAGQLNGFNDSVLKAWMEAGNPRNLVNFNKTINKHF